MLNPLVMNTAVNTPSDTIDIQEYNKQKYKEWMDITRFNAARGFNVLAAVTENIANNYKV